MSAWITRETVDDRGKVRRQKVEKGMKSIGDADRFVVEWLTPDLRRRRIKIAGKGRPAKRLADDKCEQLIAQLALGQYEDRSKKTWGEFILQYRRDVLDQMETRTAACTEQAIRSFEKLSRPTVMAGIDTQLVDTFISSRRKQRGRGKGSTASPATVNRDLRHLKAVLKRAKAWGFMREVPEVHFIREQKKIPRIVTVDEFAAIYEACEHAKCPVVQGVSPCDWWRALLVTLACTGWRIGETLSLRRADLDLKAGTARIAAEATKGRREEFIPLPSPVIDHLRALGHFHDEVFCWDANLKDLYNEWHRLQGLAEIATPHGFHDLRRSFASWNVDRMSGESLQRLMRHRTYATTQLYINLANKLSASAADVFIPTSAMRAVNS